MNEPRTKTHKRILEAIERGYFATECGKILGPKGVLSIKKSGKQRYPTFSTNWNGVFGIPAHMFAAYVFYGDESFKKGIVVRHLNADTEDIRKENLALGTYSENENDKPNEVRSNSARAARAAQGYRSLNAKLSDEQVLEVLEFYKNLEGKKAPNGSVRALCEKLGVCNTVLYNIKKGASYVPN